VLDDRLDLGEAPPEAGTREAVQEGGEIRRFPGLEAASQEGAICRLQARCYRSIGRFGLELHRA
jgi:hypothetical protein